MSATRLLVLGVVRSYGRAHGYVVLRDLCAWRAEEWANVKSGSIYHALRQLAKEGLLLATTVDKWPGRVDYEPTEAGEAEYLRLLGEALGRPDPHPDLLAAGLIFLNDLLPGLGNGSRIADFGQLGSLDGAAERRRREPRQPHDGLRIDLAAFLGARSCMGH